MKRIFFFFCIVFFSGEVFTASRKKERAPGSAAVEPMALIVQLKTIGTKAQDLNKGVTHGAGVTEAGREAELARQFLELLGLANRLPLSHEASAQLIELEKEARGLSSMGFLNCDFILQQTQTILNLLSESGASFDALELSSSMPVSHVRPVKDQIIELIQTMIAEQKSSGRGAEKSYSPKQIQLFVECIAQLLPLLETIKTSLRQVHVKKLDKAIAILAGLTLRRGRVVSVERKKQEDAVISALRIINQTLIDAAKMPFFSPTRGMHGLEVVDEECHKGDSRAKLALAVGIVFLAALSYSLGFFSPA